MACKLVELMVALLVDELVAQKDGLKEGNLVEKMETT